MTKYDYYQKWYKKNRAKRLRYYKEWWKTHPTNTLRSAAKKRMKYRMAVRLLKDSHRPLTGIARVRNALQIAVTVLPSIIRLSKFQHVTFHIHGSHLPTCHAIARQEILRREKRYASGVRAYHRAEVRKIMRNLRVIGKTEPDKPLSYWKGGV